MRTRPDGKWMPAEAEQYVTIDQPGFVWKASTQPAPFVQLTGCDEYRDGHYELDTWTTTGDTYRTLCNGIRIPTQGAATWKLKTGDFTWYKLAITAIYYNKLVLYQLWTANPDLIHFVLTRTI